MNLKLILLVLLIMNLVLMSIASFMGKKNLFLVLAFIEAILAVLFPLVDE